MNQLYSRLFQKISIGYKLYDAKTDYDRNRSNDCFRTSYVNIRSDHSRDEDNQEQCYV